MFDEQLDEQKADECNPENTKPYKLQKNRDSIYFIFMDFSPCDIKKT